MAEKQKWEVCVKTSPASTESLVIEAEGLSVWDGKLLWFWVDNKDTTVALFEDWIYAVPFVDEDDE